MATAGDPSKFEMACNDGITCNDQVRSAGFIDKLSQNVGYITDIAQDRFYDQDQKTISNSIDEFTALDEKVKETNILYERCPEKKELMQKILQEMEDYKTAVTSIDPTLYGDMCVKYNDNLEAAKIASYKDDLVTATDDYNKKPLPLEERWTYTWQAKKGSSSGTKSNNITVGKMGYNPTVGGIAYIKAYERIEDELSVNQGSNRGKFNVDHLRKAEVTKEFIIDKKSIQKSKNDNIKGTDRSQLSSDYSYLQELLKRALKKWPTLAEIKNGIDRPNDSTSYNI